MQIIQCVQGSEEWLKARLGLPTASCFNKIVKVNGSPSDQAKKYGYRLAGQKVSGVVDYSYQSQAMLNGIQLESEARRVYSEINDVYVEEVGLCIHDNGKSGCSPDGLVLDNGGLEIKCPSLETHVEYLVNDRLPTVYFQQVQGSLYVTGRDYWDFMSYCPGIKPLIIRVYRDSLFIDKLDKAIDRFDQCIQEYIKKIT